jgi:CRP-like cAMP-binding protein
MLELWERQPSRENEGSRAFPLRRQHIADATGLTGAHVNRTLNALRRDRIAAIVEGKLVIENRVALARLAGRARDTGGRA